MSLASEARAEFEPTLEVPRYDLTVAEMEALASDLLVEKSSELVSQEAVECFVIEHDSKYANLARSIEREVFEKYFGNNANEMAAEYGPYETQSIFFVSVDKTNGKPVGVMRAIENGPAGLKTLNDLNQMHDSEPETFPHVDQGVLDAAHGVKDLDECWDMGTAAVRDDYRHNTQLSVQLYRATYLAAQERGIDHYISVIDARPLGKMVKFLGIPFVPINDSESFPYLGSPASYAIHGDVREFVPRIMRKRWTARGFMARKALTPLAMGTKDEAIHL